jgi:NO-binding membrane sensor protein with MHYT domain
MYLPALLSSSSISSRDPTNQPVQGQELRIYLTAHYDLTLILTSYLVSALGGYTATQLMTQVVTTKSLRARIFWVTLASLAFGGW